MILRPTQIFATLTVISFVTACSGAINSPIPHANSLQQNQFSNIPRATPATPLDLAHPRVGERINFVAMGGSRQAVSVARSVQYQSLARWMSEKTGERKVLSVNQTYDGSGQAGFAYNTQFDDIYGNVVAYGPGSVSLPAAPSGSGSLIQDGNVIADTLHAGLDSNDGTASCIEGGSVYTDNDTFPGTTAADFYFGDFCSSPGTVNIDSIPMDSSFQSRFVRNFGDGIPQVTVEIYQPIGDSRWHGALYDYAANTWADEMVVSGNLTASNPNYSFGKYGYALFESHLYPGPCPSIPEMEEDNVQLAVEPGNDADNYFRLAQTSDTAFTPANPNGAACLSDDASGQGAWYDWYATSGANAWVMTDPKSTPPTPKPSPVPNPSVKCLSGCRYNP